MTLSALFSSRTAVLGLLWLLAGTTLALAQAALPRAQVGVPYNLLLSSPDAAAGATYEATGLPIGLSINATSGAIAGTPTTAGTSTVTITIISNGNRNAFVYQLTVDPAAGTPAITSATTAAATVGTPFTYNVTATNAPTSFNVGALPAGLTFNAGTGQISGTPTSAGTFTVPLGANNATGSGATTTLTLTVSPAGPVPAITSATAATATAVTPATNPPTYSVNYQIAASENPVSFSALGLPFGLSVNPATGVISGTTSVTGIHTIALQATNNNGTGAVRNLTLTVGALSQITSAAAVSGAIGQPLTFPLAASNAPQSFSATGVPPGLSLNTATGVISGTPSATGNFTVTVNAANAIGIGPDATLTITINAAIAPGGGGGGGGGIGGVPAVTAPIFTLQPASRAVGEGGSVTFTAQAAGTAPISYQWRRNGVAIAGATGTSYTIANVTLADAGAYSATATNAAGTTSSLAGTLSVTSVVMPPAAPPVITTQPASRTIQVGGTLSLTVVATGSEPLTYQWTKDGMAIPGANAATLTIANAPASATGAYTVTVGGGGAATTSTAAAVVIVPPASQLINLSTRGMVRTGEGMLIAGFVITGDSPKPVLLRAVGPSLSGFGVAGALTDPVLEVFNQSSGRIGGNDNWGSASAGSSAAAVAGAGARVGAFTLSTGTGDAALYLTLAPGAYTAQVSGNGNATGVALVEIYDASESAAPTRLINVATRGDVGRDENMLIAGFVIRGTQPKRLLVRAAGPALLPFGVTAALADPRVQLYREGALVSENDNWGSAGDAAQVAAAAGSVGAFSFASGSRDAVLLVTLDPGVYSAHVSGVGNTTGTALVEVYELP